MATLGWGIVGTGRGSSELVAPARAACEGAELVGVVSRDEGRAAELAGRHGRARALTSYDELLADPSVDVVYIGTPNAHHADQIVAAAGAGKHVFCDKPLATSIEDARRAVDAADAAGVKLGVNFQTRYHDVVAEIRELIGAGAIGEVLIVQCELSPGRKPLRGWRTDPELAVLGTTNNLGVHAYDLLRRILDAEPIEVTALLDVGRRAELETISLALIRFSNGALAYVNANQAVPDSQPDLVIYGAEGRILGRSVMRPGERGELAVTRDGQETTIPTSSEGAYEGCVAAFQQAVLDDEEPNPSGVDGLRSVQFTAALARSAREGRVVEIPA